MKMDVGVTFDGKIDRQIKSFQTQSPVRRIGNKSAVPRFLEFSGFGVNSPNFATTPHGNWATWGYLNGCRIHTAEKKNWGVQFSWQGCNKAVPVVADFVANFGHEWAGSLDSNTNREGRQKDGLDFTDMAWQFILRGHSVELGTSVTEHICEAPPLHTTCQTMSTTARPSEDWRGCNIFRV